MHSLPTSADEDVVTSISVSLSLSVCLSVCLFLSLFLSLSLSSCTSHTIYQGLSRLVKSASKQHAPYTFSKKLNCLCELENVPHYGTVLRTRRKGPMWMINNLPTSRRSSTWREQRKNTKKKTSGKPKEYHFFFLLSRCSLPQELLVTMIVCDVCGWRRGRGAKNLLCTNTSV